MGESTEVVKRLVQAYDAGDIDAYADLLAPDVVFVDNSESAVVGRDVLWGLATRQRRLFPDLVVERTHWLEAGEWVAFRFLAKGTNSVESPGLPATGRSVEFQGASHQRVVNGKLVELLQVWDEASLLRQIGQLPSGPSLK